MPNEETSPSGAEQLQILLAESEREHKQIQQELREIDVLIRQTTTEVERLAQQNTQLATRVRQMEMNLDSYPRKDIKELYDQAHEAQMRLFMMQGQLEQLQNRQQNLEAQGQRASRFAEAAGRVTPSEMAALSAGGARPGHSDLVRVIEAQEHERQRLARQVHDGPAQSLTNLILQAEICERLFDTDPAQARVELGNLKNTVNTTFQKTRDFILTLRPMMLDDLGLVPTLKQYVQDFEEKTGLSINLAVVGRELRLPTHGQVTIFRLIQELLTNVQRHAHANRVQVTLDYKQDRVVASVEDDGSGFDVSELQSATQQHAGLGLPTIQERAEMLGGHVYIESRIGRGTRVRIEIPVAQD